MRKSLSPILQSRYVVTCALDDVLARKFAIEEALEKQPSFHKLESRDRAFALLLSKTTIRRLGQIDNLIAQWLSSPLPQDAREITHILRIGMAQLLWIETPSHAAVHTSVELAKQSKWPRLSGLVNALLQRAIREGKEVASTQDAEKINQPGWLFDNWVEAYGEEAARAITFAHQSEPPLDISVKSDAAHWAEKLGGDLLPNHSVRLSKVSNLTELPGFAEGAWWVQDAAASLPVNLLGDIQGKNVIDMCAAPGGKTAQLAALGAKVTALDISKTRMRRVDENLKRLQLGADCVVANANEYSPAQAPDCILLDAPCSATGTIRRHPDVAWHRQPSDVERLVKAQARLLDHAFSILIPGGLLVYAVCSLQPEEGEKQIEQMLARYAHIHKKDSDIFASMPEMVEKNPFGWRTLPSFLKEKGGMDGFFMSILQKN